jgi:hypothetical protein
MTNTVDGLLAIGTMWKVRSILGIQGDAGCDKFQNAVAVKSSLDKVYKMVRHKLRGSRNIFAKLRKDVDSITSAIPTPVKKRQIEYFQKQSRK